MIYDGSYGRCDENSRQDLDIKSLTGLTERTEKNEKLCGLCGLCEGKRIVNLRGLQVSDVRRPNRQSSIFNSQYSIPFIHLLIHTSRVETTT